MDDLLSSAGRGLPANWPSLLQYCRDDGACCDYAIRLAASHSPASAISVSATRSRDDFHRVFIDRKAIYSNVRQIA
jgi:hypothetical protein